MGARGEGAGENNGGDGNNGCDSAEFCVDPNAFGAQAVGWTASMDCSCTRNEPFLDVWPGLLLLLLLLAVVVSTCFLEPFNIDRSPGPSTPEEALVVDDDEVEGTGREVEDSRSYSQLSAGATKVDFAASTAAGTVFPIFVFALGAALLGAPRTGAPFASVGTPFFFDCCGTLLVVTAEVAESRGDASVAAGGGAAVPTVDAMQVVAAAAAAAVVAVVLVEVGQAYALWPCSPHVKQALRATRAAFSEAVSSAAGCVRLLTFLAGTLVEQRARSVALSSGYSFFSRPI